MVDPYTGLYRLQDDVEVVEVETEAVDEVVEEVVEITVDVVAMAVTDPQSTRTHAT